MKKTMLLLVVSFAFCAALSAQISRIKADEMVFERMSKETKDFVVYGKDDLQTEMTVATTAGETIELDYACWVYFIRYTDAGYYLIVNKSNGKLLEAKSKDMGIPENLATWRVVKNPADVEKATVYAGTKWKFVGFVDTLSNSIIELNPKDCNACYTLSFYEDNCAYANLISDMLEIELRYLRSIPTIYLHCLAYVEDNSEIFDRDAVFTCLLYASSSYTVTDDELKFFSGEGKSRYMLFKRNRMDESTGALVGTKWKLEGSVEVETGELTAYVTKDFEEFECERCNQPPFHHSNFDLKDCMTLPECEECYTITFGSDTTFTGRMFTNTIFGNYHINYTTGEFRGYAIGGTRVLDLCELVIDCKEKLYTISSFSLQENKLKLYYNDEKNYFLFKKKER
jgi:hypothetical protein